MFIIDKSFVWYTFLPSTGICWTKRFEVYNYPILNGLGQEIQGRSEWARYLLLFLRPATRQVLLRTLRRVLAEEYYAACPRRKIV